MRSLIQIRSLMFSALLLSGCEPAPTPQSSEKPPVQQQTNAQPQPASVLPAASNYQIPEIPAGEILQEARADKSSTLLVFNGIHVRPPFRLIRTKYRMILEGSNARVLMHEFPRRFKECPETLPVLPADITASTTFAEMDRRKDFGRSQLQAARLYFACRFRTAETAQQFTEYVQSLPFVASTEWVGANDDPEHSRQYLRIISKAGEERRMFAGGWDPSKPTNGMFSPTIGFPSTEFLIADSPESLAWIEKQFHSTWNLIHSRLSRDFLYIFHDNGSQFESFQSPVEPELAKLAEILRSGGSAEQRSTAIAEIMDISAAGERKDWEPYLQHLIATYDATPEMKEWLATFKLAPANPMPTQ